MFLILYGQRIQMFMILRNVGKKLSKLEEWNVNSKNTVLESLIEKSDDEEIVKKRFDRLLSSFVIPPVSIDKYDDNCTNSDDIATNHGTSRSIQCSYTFT